ncbi:translocation/assembly module TamB domain-containing protein [Oricola nitratireducens]|uniref:translocation/assembly module TamB domain-containing protein n=1 Tax=Oricola nitratireducens TaxID=2775868 RepID=UPI0018668F1D|nr:translocation/assembly module TamB domain-containing protein [Oricola nitratireducens]
MTANRFLSRFLLLVLCLWPGALAHAQTQDDEEKSSLIRFVEEQLSAPNRQISLNGIKGTLSSDVSFDSITIADQDGVWLTIVKPRLQWSRTALLTGTLSIQSLSAERIDWPRMPAADKSLPAPEARQFSLPELPVSVQIGEIAIDEAHFGEPVFGLASTLSLKGSLSLGDGALATKLDIARLDGPGGQLALEANYSNASSQLGVNLSLQEAADGVVANLLNIPDRPPVALTASGEGPLDNFDLDLAFDVAGERIATGSFSLNDAVFSGDRRADIRLSGPIAKILPEAHRAFFGAETSLTADVVLHQGGAIDLRQLKLDSGALDITASGSTVADGFPSEFTADMTLRSADGAPVLLPLSGDPVTVDNGTLKLQYGAGEWTLSGSISGIDTAKAKIGQIRLDGSGAVTGVNNPDSRSITFKLDGDAEGISPDDPGIARAVGDRVTLAAGGDWSSGNPVRLATASVQGDTARIGAQGLLDGLTFKGKARIEAADLAAFSLIADRDLAGSTALAVDGDIALAGGSFDLAFDGTLTDASFDSPAADRLLSGETKLTGSAARSADGLHFRELNLANDQASARIDGVFASSSANLRAHAEVFDIARIDERGSGRLTLDASIDKREGSERSAPFDVSARLGLDSARLVGRAVPNAEIAFDGRMDAENIAGNIKGSGLIGGETIDIAGAFARNGERLSLSDFAARIGFSQLTGDVTVENSLADGRIGIVSNDISPLAALALADAAGVINGTVTLSAPDGRQDATAAITVSKARYETTKIGNAEIEANIRDLFGTPRIDAKVDGRAIDAAGIAISELSATSATEGALTRFSANAALDNGTRVAANGNLQTTAGGFDATLETLTAQSRYGDVKLTAPATISRSGDTTRIESLQANVGGGRVSASGTIAQTIDISADVSALPLSIVNGFRPDLGLGGTLDGSVKVSGPTGSPQASFTIRGNGLDAAALRSASVSPIALTASGSYQDGTVRLAQVTARNAQDLDFTGSGTIPLSGGGLSVRVNGGVPLTFAERFLAERGTRLGGTLRIDATVTGSLAAPNADGLFSLSGATVSDPLSNLRLNQVGGVAGLRGDTISINRFTGQLAGGGSVSVSGTIGLSGGLPANLDIVLSKAVYSDAQTIRTTLSGDLSVTGQLTAGPLLSGRIDLLGTEITVPETIGNEADLLEVRHVDPDGATLRTLQRIEAVLPKDGGSSPQAPVRLDVTINSPNRIFVRGRGIDAELGGRLRVTGPLDALQPVGSFNLIRGRLSILNKRLQLTEGRITLTGSLDPMINLVAQVSGDEIVANVGLSGRASDLSLDLSSSPELPQDEILARVLFGKGIANLSPLQIANLATAAASLASGGSGVGLSEQIRRGIGVDDLDVVQDKEGNVAVKAGKYIQDNVYLDVQAGQSGGEASINLDVTDSLTAKGTVNSSGDTKFGVFFEKDY